MHSSEVLVHALRPSRLIRPHVIVDYVEAVEVERVDSDGGWICGRCFGRHEPAQLLLPESVKV